MAKKVPGKEEFFGLIDWYRTMLVEHGVDVRLEVEGEADDLVGFDHVIVATGVVPRDPGIPTSGGMQVVNYVDILTGRAVAGKRVAIVGAGGIGFDVAEFLTHDGESPAENLDLWKEEWGVSDPGKHRGGLAPEGASPAPSPRKVTLLQRKAERPGKRLGKTTGWIHRTSLMRKGVKMMGGTDYVLIDRHGLHVTTSDGPALIECDTVVLCAGQEPERRLRSALEGRGVEVHVIGGADVAAELDAKRAIDQGARLAAGL